MRGRNRPPENCAIKCSRPRADSFAPNFPRHCERSEAIHAAAWTNGGLLRSARNCLLKLFYERVSRKIGMLRSGWPPGPERGEIDRLAMGLTPVVILVVSPLPLERLMS